MNELTVYGAGYDLSRSANVTEAVILCDGSNSAPCAYVVPRVPAAQESLLRQCFGESGRGNLVRLASLPRRSDGSIDSHALAAMEPLGQQLREQVPDHLAVWGAGTVKIRVGEARLPITTFPRVELAAESVSSLSGIPALSGQERPERAVDAPKNLAEAFDRVAAETTNGVVLDSLKGETVRMTYAELREHALCLAHALQAKGYRPGQPMMIPATNRFDTFISFWACVYASFVAVPCAASWTDPSPRAGERIKQVWELLDRPPVLVDDAEAIHPILRDEVAVLRPCEAEQVDNELAPINPLAPVVFLMTSGSTGMPKLVVQRHQSISAMILGEIAAMDLGREDVDYNWFSMDHVVPLLMCHVRDTWIGMEQVHTPTQVILERPTLWLDAMSKHRASLSWAPNFAFALVSNAAKSMTGATWDLSAVRVLINAGEMVVAEQVGDFLTTLAPYGLREDCVVPAWGMSETCSVTTVSAALTLADCQSVGPVNLGSPVPGLVLRIVDKEGNVVLEGEDGELEVSGECVLWGYEQNKPANEASFTEDGWLKTGDLARIVAGQLFVLGRVKNVIRINSTNIGATEIEAVAERAEGVLKSFTAAGSFRPRGATTDELVVFYCPEPGKEREAKDGIRRELVSHFGFAARVLIALAPEEVPKTSIGKLRRADLCANLEAGIYDAQLPDMIARNEVVHPWIGHSAWVPHEMPARKSAAWRPSLLLVGAEGTHSTEGLIASNCATWAEAVELIGQQPEREVVYVLPAAELSEPEVAVATWVRRVEALVSGQTVLPSAITLVAVDPAQDAAVAALGALCRAWDATAGFRMRVINTDSLDLALHEVIWLDVFDASVRYRGGVREVQRVLTAQVGTAAVNNHPEGSVVILVGGFGGIGSQILKRDGELAGARVIVVGRRPEPDPKIVDALTSPASVEYIQGWNAATEGALRELLTAYSLEGAHLSRIYHLAGVGQTAGDIYPAESEIADMFSAKLAPLDGLARLADEFGGTVLAFSSVNAIVGTVAASVYGAANAAMEEKLAQLRRDGGLDARVIAWSRWSGVGMSHGADDDELARSRGFSIMSAEESYRLLAHLRDLDAFSFVVGLEPCSPFMRSIVESPALPLDQLVIETSRELPAAAATDLARELKLAVELKVEMRDFDADSDGSGCSLVEGKICEVLERVVGLGSVTRHDGFFELGVQSLHIPRILSELSSVTGYDLIAADLFEAPNVAALARKIAGEGSVVQETSDKDSGFLRRKRLSSKRGGADTHGE